MADPHWLLPDRPFASLGEYLSYHGASAVGAARQREPDELLTALRRSGLRGRGGAGFPTGIKWGSIAGHPCPVRYVAMNAAEGEPGTFKDRYLLRRNPYGPLDGMLVAARVVGAAQAFIAIKATFRPEIGRLREALAEFDEEGLLGNVDVRIVEGPDEYLFGEETAMLSVIEGEGPFPRPLDQPPYEVGLFSTPSSPNPIVVNNVETFAHAATIVQHGADSFRETGSEDTPGTILVTLSGNIARPGVYELPAGTPLQQILELGGGAGPGRQIRAVLSGVAAGIITPDRFSTPADFASFQLIGSGLGSAGFIVVDDATPIAAVLQSVARFLYVESCNQCFACKAGLRTASRAADAVLTGASYRDPLGRIVSGARSSPQGNRCYLPVQARALLPSLTAAFGEELEKARLTGTPHTVWPLPKIVDYDESSHTFELDLRQTKKRPDWSYPQPEAAAGRAAPQPNGTHPVELPEALGRALEERAHARGTDVDQLVADILDAWIQAQPLG